MSAYGPQNRHVLAVAACRLLGDERTSIRHRLRSVYDPVSEVAPISFKIEQPVGRCPLRPRARRGTLEPRPRVRGFAQRALFAYFWV